jgi:HAD superfamily hydrolase (TIGR01509 family)
MAKRRVNGITTILFDLDDTLLDSYGARVQALRDVFKQAQISGVDPDSFLSALQGATFNDALGKLAEERHIEDDLFNFYRRAYWFNKGRIRLYPGIREMLEALKSRKYKLGIVTNKGRNFEFEGRYIGCTGELKEVGVYDYFSVIIGFEDVKEGKPHPEGVKVALSKLGSQPQDTLFVGDSAADIQAAFNAECLSCHAIWGITSDNRLPQNLKPHYTVKAPDAILSLDCI